jgi:DNA helicase II / ATP-dependent DNA helicase PcrA
VHPLLSELNPAQREAAAHIHGPLLVLAGPGSGKTRVITHRIAYLITEAGVPPWSLLAVTFTNKAAEEMQHRLRRMLEGQTPMTSTFHRFCSRMLRQFGAAIDVDPHFSIIDQDDRLQVITRIVKESQLDPTHFSPRRIEQRISQLKNDLTTAEEFAAQTHDFFGGIVADVYPKYQKRLTEMNAVDFDDLLFHMVRLLREKPDVRLRLDSRFRFMLVDEYQDTNLAQFEIARLMKQDFRNLCVTGDPDQSIYSWRGANPKNVFHFEEHYPDAKIVRLEENYRSTKSILAAADGLIRKNSKRKHKELRTANEEGAPVSVYCHATDDAEANFIAEIVRQAVDEGGKNYRDFAVFLRTSALWGRIETALRARHVPYQVVGGMSFFQRKEVKDVTAYARLACNSRDDSAFERIVNVPPRGVGETSLQKLRSAAQAKGTSLIEACQNPGLLTSAGIKGKQRAALAAFADMHRQFAELATGRPDTALRAILDATDYRTFVDGDDEEEVKERLDNIDGLLYDAEQFVEQEPTATLRDFLELVGLVGAIDERDGKADLVTVMTLHAAKGLEFPVVFMPAFEHGLLPHERSLNDGDIEEERRLAFVGITRAREQLYLSYTTCRSQYGRLNIPAPSQFLEELPAGVLQREDFVRPMRPRFDPYDHSQETHYEEPAIQIRRKSSGPSSADRFSQGMLVDHPRYGRGRIVELDGIGPERKATIQFPAVGQKRFVLEKAPLEPA